MKKKVFAIVLTIVLALSMTACGGTKKAETKEDTKQTETQVDGEEQEVVETSEEALNEYGVTDEEMQLYLDKFKGKIEEKKAVYQDYENMKENSETEIDIDSEQIWDDFMFRNELEPYVSTGGGLCSTDEILEPRLKEESDNMWIVHCKATKEWKEEGNISEEKCKKFLLTTFDDLTTFRDTYLVPAYNEVVKE